MFQETLTLEDQSTVGAIFLGLINTSDQIIEIYKNDSGLFHKLNDASIAYPLENEEFLDMAVEYLHHKPIENESLYKAVHEICIQDQKKVGKNFPYFKLQTIIPPHARYALIVVNDYGFWPKGVLNPIYHCIEALDMVETEFGCAYLTNNEDNIVLTRYPREPNVKDQHPKDSSWNEAFIFLRRDSVYSNRRTLEFYPESQQQIIIDAVSKLNTDFSYWL